MMAEKLSVVMARRHLEAADVALLPVIDATEGVTSSDATIGAMRTRAAAQSSWWSTNGTW